jgi:hypothetical protein
MSQKMIALLLAALYSPALLGCSSDDDSNACTVAPPSDTASADGKVTYTASVTGNGSVDVIEYKTSSGSETVKKPSLPFTVTIDVKENDPIGITVTGSASNGGKVIAAYGFLDSAGIDPVETSAECGG